MIKHSPCSVLSGQEPKVGLSSTSLHFSVLNTITTGEELRDELGLPAAVPNTIDEVTSDEEVEEPFMMIIKKATGKMINVWK